MSSNGSGKQLGLRRLLKVSGVCAVALLLTPGISSGQVPADAGGRADAGAVGVRPLVPCDIMQSSQSGNYATNLWPGGVLPYEFDANVDDRNRRRAIAAMAEIEHVSCVDFVERTEEADYLHIQDDVENSSWVGQVGGPQTVKIYNWSYRFIIAHEMMHATGVWHEQQRPDRDAFVRIEWDRIPSDKQHNFDIPPDATEYAFYDFDSVMHYGQCAFSVCEDCGSDPTACRTITVLAPNEDWQDFIGQRDHLSSGDATVLAYLYGNGNEKISTARCKTRSGEVRSTLVKVKKAVPNREYTATLDTGEVLTATASSRGKLKFKFKGNNAPPCGPNGVTVDCAYRSFSCCTPPDMVPIPAGEFAMGDPWNEGDPDERPVHNVYLSSYSIGRYEVTNEQYAAGLNWAWARGGLITVIDGVVYKDGSGTDFAYCDTTGSTSYSRITWDGSSFGVVTGKENHPMVRVSWYGAAAYCNWRSAMEGRTACYDLETWDCDFNADGYRLPTEAEWEKAAGWDPEQQRHFRFGEHTDGCGFDCLDGARANYWGSGDPFETGDHPKTTPVGYYDGTDHGGYRTQDARSYYGCYDMSGNVWDWCNDWYGSTYYNDSPHDNPKGPDGGSSRVLHGGSWRYTPWYLRSANRFWAWPVVRYLGGFRVASGT